MKTKRILHLTYLREIGSGQRQQLIYEVSASKKIANIQWDTMVYHCGESIESFERKIPSFFDFPILRNLYCWLLVLKFSKEYDLILLRHLVADPFALIFSPFVKNRLGVHHTKEIDEYKLMKGWKGALIVFLEKYTGKVAVKNSLGVVGVTEEIALYENKERNLNKPTFVYPNGVEVDKIPLAQDNRVEDEFHFIFICSYFYDWHGLDILLKAINHNNLDEKYFIHLVGNLTIEQKLEIEKNKNKEKIIVHGILNQQQYLDVASKCDVGLGSFALFRNNLQEGSTLKVREMLAMGLPVFSGHKDSAFDGGFDFYKYSQDFNLVHLLAFCKANKKISRREVRETSKDMIEKKKIMEKFILQTNMSVNG